MTGVTDADWWVGHPGVAIHPQQDIVNMTRRPAPTRHLASHGLFRPFASRSVLRMYVRWGASSFLILGSISLAAVAL